MRITVHAQPHAREELLEPLGNCVYKISVKEPPTRGKANAAIARVLAARFNVPSGSVRLISGAASKIKRFEIPDPRLPL